MEVKKTKIKINKLVHSESAENLAESKTIRDLRSFLSICRLFGLAPYTMSSRKISLSQTGTIYTGIIIIYYVYIIYLRTNVVFNEEIDFNLKVLTIGRIMIMLTTTCVDALLCIYWDKKLQNCLNNIGYYEKLLNLEEMRTNRFVIITWMLIFGNLILYSFLACLSYLFDNDDGLIALIYLTLFLSMTFGILKFLIIVIIIRRRFRYFNSYIAKGLFFLFIFIHNIFTSLSVKI